MTVAQDASTPASVNNTTTAALTCASFTPPAGALILALVSIGNSSGAATAITGSVSDNLGTHLNWTMLNRLNTSSDGSVECWIADVVTSAAMTVTLTKTGGTICKGSLLSPMVITGAANVAGQNGAKPTTSGTIGGISITPTKIGSYLACVLSANASSTARTALANSTFIGTAQDATNGETYNALKLTTLSLSTAAVTIGASTTIASTLIAGVEIVPAAALAAGVWGIPMHA